MRRPLLAILLAAATLAAGCVAIPEDVSGALLSGDGGRVSTGAVLHKAGGPPLAFPPGLARAAGAQYSIGVDATEPTLGVDQAGNVFMTGFGDGFYVAPTIMRSMDKGQSFEDAGPKIPGTSKGRHMHTFDPYVVVDRETGRVFMDDIWPLSCGSLSFSDDQGASWTTNPYSCGNTHVNDHQTLGVGKPRRLATVGYPNVVYRCVNNLAYPACAMSVNGGLSFTPQIPVTALAVPCGGSTGHVATDPEGRVFLGTTACEGYVPHVAVSEDDGLTWQAFAIDPQRPGDRGTHDVEIAADAEGNLYAVWTHEGRVWLSRSFDHGRTWTAARDVTSPEVTATMFATVAAAGPGRIAIAYVGSTIEGGYEGKPGGVGGLMGDIVGEPDPEAWREATWNAYLAISIDALEEDLTFQTVTANDPADPLARGLCGRTRCHGMNDFIDVEIDEEGRPWAAFVDVCTEACVTNPDVRHDRPVGFVGTLVAGPSLAPGGGVLGVLAPPPSR